MSENHDLKDISKKILQANLKNIAEKVKAGHVLSVSERQLFEKYTETDAIEISNECASSFENLAKKLGISSKTLQRYRKRYNNAPKDLNLAAWKAFQGLVSETKVDDNDLATRKAKSELKRSELACKKLEIEIKKLEDLLVERVKVVEDGANLGAIIKSAFSKLEKELAGRLEGKTPEERQVEIRIIVSESIDSIIKSMDQIESLKK